MRHRSRRALIGVVVVLGLVAAACGSSKSAKSAPGFDTKTKTIKLGVLTAMTGPAAVIGKTLANGQDVYFKYLNEEKGGIAGKYKVQLVVEDHAYQTNTTVQQYNKIKNDVVMFSQVMGTPEISALLPLLKQDNIIVSPASQDAMWVREQQLMPIIEPYQIDAINAISWYVKEGGGQGKKIGVIMQNDVYGEAGLEGVKFAASKLGFDVTSIARFKFGDQDFTAQVTQLKGAGVQAVYAVAQPTEFGKILGTAAQLGYKPQWIGQSPSWIDALGKTALKPYLEGLVYIAAVGPEWGDESVPGMDALLARVQKYSPDQQPNYYFSFGYFQAMAVAEVLEKAVAKNDLSRAGMIKAMNSMDALTFEGYMGDYKYGTPAQRDPGRISTIFKVNMSKPFGLQAVKQNFTTPEAASFSFNPAG